MKKPFSLLVTAVFLTQNLPVLYAVETATVKSVRVSAESVYITTDRPVEYKAFIMSRPPKLVVELLDTRLKTLEDIPVNGSLLKRVRTGQFKMAPASVSRVVLELSQRAAYEITRKGEELAVILGEKAQARTTPEKPAPGTDTAGTKIIKPSAGAPGAAPVELKLEPAPAELSGETVPVIQPRKSKAARAVYRSILDNLSGEEISFDYNDADIHEVIGMMAAKAGVNVIYAEDVSGTITLNLSRVPFDEAFRTILDVKGLAAQQVGDNILRIATPKTFLADQKKAMLQTKVFFLNYSKASEVKVQVDAVANAENRKANSTVDESNNALIITDTPMGLGVTSHLIKNLDRVPRQVMIEAKLVEVILDNSFALGVNWSSYQKDGTSYIGGASGGAPQDMSAGGTGVDLPIAGPTGAFRFGKIASDGMHMFNAVITAKASKGKAKVLSNPKVATLNNKEATINITEQTPFSTSNDTVGLGGAIAKVTQTTYIPTGIVLKVTPTINSDGRISMHVIPTVSGKTGGSATTAPATNTRSTDTNVIVRNGETLVIGGLITDNQSDRVNKVPLLGDIPLLGYLFRSKTVTRERVELLIFVTPRIIED